MLDHGGMKAFYNAFDLWFLGVVKWILRKLRSSVIVFKFVVNNNFEWGAETGTQGNKYFIIASALQIAVLLMNGIPCVDKYAF